MFLTKDKIKLAEEFDFNKLSEFINHNNCTTEMSGNWRNDYIFDNPIGLRDIHRDPYFQNIYKYLNINFNKENKKSVLLLYANFQAGGKSVYHSDDGVDVYMIGLFGKTLVLDQNNDETLVQKGDLLYIKSGEKHRVLSLTPRIVCSWYIPT